MENGRCVSDWKCQIITCEKRQLHIYWNGQRSGMRVAFRKYQICNWLKSSGTYLIKNDRYASDQKYQIHIWWKLCIRGEFVISVYKTWCRKNIVDNIRVFMSFFFWKLSRGNAKIFDISFPRHKKLTKILSRGNAKIKLRKTRIHNILTMSL